jgi:hypothetical protein
MTSYETFVNKYHRYQYAPRTMSEAFRDADYGTAIWKCEQPESWRSYALIESVVIMLSFGVVGYMLSFYLS